MRRAAAGTALVLFSGGCAALAAPPARQNLPARAPFKVILDPGHGGEDAGALRAHGTRRLAEKDLTLAVARQAARILRARGIRVALTREDDRFVPLDRRTELANAEAAAGNAVLISIHANAAHSSEARGSSGVETYVFNATTNEASRRLAELENGNRWAKPHPTVELILADLAATANHQESVELACSIQAAATRAHRRRGEKLRDRGVRQALFYVLMQSRMPSALFELGFISHPDDLARLTRPDYQRLLALSLANGITRYRSRLKRRFPRTHQLSGVSKPSCQIH